MEALDALAARGDVAILDGALGTELERRGVTINGSRLWSARLLADNPRLVREIHLDYLRSGADVVTTASYQVGPGAAAGQQVAVLPSAPDQAVPHASASARAWPHGGACACLAH
jgi:S-methylmethionine-dependent homocysteine/selenocysteine methylase